MGHYSYFCGCTSSEAVLRSGQGHEPLLEAKYYVPLFWLAAFGAEDLAIGEADGNEYAALCCTTSLGLERLRRRRDAIVDLVGARFGPFYDEWIQFVSAKYPAMLLLRVNDLFNMTTFESAGKRLRENLEALAPADLGKPLENHQALEEFAYIKGVDDASRETLVEAATRSRAIFAGWAYSDEPWPPLPTAEEIAWIDERTPKDWTTRSIDEVLAHVEELLVQQVARTRAEMVSPLVLHILVARGHGAAVDEISKHLGKPSCAALHAWLYPKPRDPDDRRSLPGVCVWPCTHLHGAEGEAEVIALGFVAAREGDAAIDELLEQVDPECTFHPALLLLGATWGRGILEEAWREKLAAPKDADIRRAYEEGEISPFALEAFKLAGALAGGGGRDAEDAFVNAAMDTARNAAAAYVDHVLQRLDGLPPDQEAVQRASEKLESLVESASSGLSRKEALPKIARQARALHDAGGAETMVRFVAALEKIWGPLGALLTPLTSTREDTAVLDILSSTPLRSIEAADVELIRDVRTSSRARAMAALVRDGNVHKMWYPLGRLLNHAELDEEALLCLVPVVKLASEAATRLRTALPAELAKLEIPTIIRQ